MALNTIKCNYLTSLHFKGLITNIKHYIQSRQTRCSNSPRTVIVDTGFCVDNLLQTSNERQPTYKADIVAKNNSVNDQ